MTFTTDMEGFKKRFIATNDRVIYELGKEAFISIRDGSALTGAPGQPVDEGDLRASWTLEYPSPREALITTSDPKAQAIEHGVRRIGSRRRGVKIFLTVRSAFGGFHSLKLTRANFFRLVDVVVTRVRGAA